MVTFTPRSRTHRFAFVSTLLLLGNRLHSAVGNSTMYGKVGEGVCSTDPVVDVVVQDTILCAITCSKHESCVAFNMDPVSTLRCQLYSQFNFVENIGDDSCYAEISLITSTDQTTSDSGTVVGSSTTPSGALAETTTTASAPRTDSVFLGQVYNNGFRCPDPNKNVLTALKFTGTSLATVSDIGCTKFLPGFAIDQNTNTGSPNCGTNMLLVGLNNAANLGSYMGYCASTNSYSTNISDCVTVTPLAGSDLPASPFETSTWDMGVMCPHEGNPQGLYYGAMKIHFDGAAAVTNMVCCRVKSNQ
ncbi:uncharacterized protein LOC143024298 [Oratosquilla oratoria]|uniref:uncharacterized protein LOC143024298 n=1 Tax=Oratosquilla oratoria TaxID=337810 RepID=UPI003F76F3CE